MSIFDVFRRNKGYKFNLDNASPLSKEQLEKMEKDNNVKFPDSLRDYWLKYGDASIKTCNFKGDKDITDLNSICIPNDRLLSIGRENGWLPESYYPIARDSGGNYYCWNCKDNKVYLLLDGVDEPRLFEDSVESLFTLMNKCDFKMKL